IKGSLGDGAVGAIRLRAELVQHLAGEGGSRAVERSGGQGDSGKQQEGGEQRLAQGVGNSHRAVLPVAALPSLAQICPDLTLLWGKRPMPTAAQLARPLPACVADRLIVALD